MWRFAGLALVLALVAGCGNVAQRLTSDSQFQQEVLAAIAADETLAAKTLDSLVIGRRDLVVDKVLGNGETVQALMTRMAQDRTMLDGIVNVAVQDTAMRSHVMALFQGMQMMSKAP